MVETKNKAEALKGRTKQFALRVIRVIRSLPPGFEGRIIGHQLLRSGISAAANYRAVCRARSRPEFLAKLSIVIRRSRRIGILAGIAGRRRPSKGSEAEGIKIRGQSTRRNLQRLESDSKKSLSINNHKSKINNSS
jgi:four helix bundle protein